MTKKPQIDPAKLLAELREHEAAIKAADTPANEARLMQLFATKAATIKRGRQKGPQRYTVRMANGSVGPVTLLELERLWHKISRGKS